MAIEIIMPKNGMDMKEGVLIRWLKNVGDRVERDEPIMVIETDKVTMESESPASGVLLARYFDEGAVIPVLTVMGYIGEAGETAPAAPSAISAAASPPSNVLIAPDDAVSARPAQAADEKWDYDAAVIGGGPAGYVAAIKIAQLGGRAVLFERDVCGGTCLNRGCVPTKTYLKTAEYLHNIRRAAERGIVSDTSASVDMKRVVAYKNKVVKKLTSGVDSLLKSQSVAVERGHAEAKSAHEVVCNGRAFTARNLILCGGSKPGLPNIPGIEHPSVLDSDAILSLEELPEKLCIIGGGVIGCEIACAFSAFGSEVTIVEMLPALVANMDESIAKAMKKSLEANGVKVLTGAAVRGFEDASGRIVVVTDSSRIEADKVLISTGRVSDTSCAGALPLKTERGMVVVNDRMETSLPGVYAAGDITGRLMLAHAAFKMAETAAENVMGGSASASLKYTPYCVYTLPEAAGVGLTEAEARTERADGVAAGNFPLAANGRSVASGEAVGFVKVLIDRTFGEILGVHIFGSNAAEMIAEPAALMSMEVTAHEVADAIIHAHPTFSEAFMEACADALGRCVHLPKK